MTQTPFHGDIYVDNAHENIPLTFESPREEGISVTQWYNFGRKLQQVPTSQPTSQPTQVPTFNPTNSPTSQPTQVPTSQLTQVLTPFPTPLPTQVPTPIPTTPSIQVPSPSPTPPIATALPTTASPTISNQQCTCPCSSSSSQPLMTSNAKSAKSSVTSVVVVVHPTTMAKNSFVGALAKSVSSEAVVLSFWSAMQYTLMSMITDVFAHDLSDAPLPDSPTHSFLSRSLSLSLRRERGER